MKEIELQGNIDDEFLSKIVSWLTSLQKCSIKQMVGKHFPNRFLTNIFKNLLDLQELTVITQPSDNQLATNDNFLNFKLFDISCLTNLKKCVLSGLYNCPESSLARIGKLRLLEEVILENVQNAKVY